VKIPGGPATVTGISFTNLPLGNREGVREGEPKPGDLPEELESSG